MNLQELAEHIELLVLDVDGVLTDGRIVYGSDGSDMKFFNVLDGMGVSLMAKAGLKVAFMSAKASKVIRRRAESCKVGIVLEDVSNKGEAIRSLSDELNVSLDKIAFVGDDLVDIRAMKLVGFPIAVANAVDEVKQRAKYITEKQGGFGAVREVCELILKAKGLWQGLVEEF